MQRQSNRRFSRTLLTIAAVGAVACATSKAGPTSRSRATTATSGAESVVASLPDLRPHQELPEEVRDALDARMYRHGTQMTNLTLYVLLLQYGLVEELAKQLADEPTLGRPAKGEAGTLNAMLPDAFFAHQEDLRQSARRLQSAAKDRDQQGLATSFGEVARSCIGCHGAYLQADFDLREDRDLDDVPCGPDDECEDDDGSVELSENAIPRR